MPFPSPMHEVKSESEVAQLCLTLQDPMDCSLPGSSAHGIFQARVLEWGAIAFSNRHEFEQTPGGSKVEGSMACCSPWGSKGAGPTLATNQHKLWRRQWHPLQYSCLENPMDGGAWWAAVHGVAKSRTRLSVFTFTFHFMHWRRKWYPTPVFLPGEPQGWGSLVGC